MKSVSEFNIERQELLINKLAYDNRVSLQTKGFLMSLSHLVNTESQLLKPFYFSDVADDRNNDLYLFGTEIILSLMPINDEKMASKILAELLEHKFITMVYPRNLEERTGETKEEYMKSGDWKYYRLNFCRVTIGNDNNRRLNEDFYYMERENK